MELTRFDSKCNSCEVDLNSNDKYYCFECLLVFCQPCVTIENDQCMCRLCNLVELTPEKIQQLTKRDLQVFLFAQDISFEPSMEKSELIKIVTEKQCNFIDTNTSSSADNLVDDFEILNLLGDQSTQNNKSSSSNSFSAANQSELLESIVGPSRSDTSSTDHPPLVKCESCEETHKDSELYKCSNCKLFYCILCNESFECEAYKCRRCLFFEFYKIPITQDSLEELQDADLRWFLQKHDVKNLQPDLAKQQLINRILTHVRAEDQDEEQAPQQVESDNEMKLCKICLKAEMNCVLIGCGHMMCCYECGTRLHNDKSNCPVCRQVINQVQRIFIS